MNPFLCSYQICCNCYEVIVIPAGMRAIVRNACPAFPAAKWPDSISTPVRPKVSLLRCM
jgi:hypothetical protein